MCMSEDVGKSIDSTTSHGSCESLGFEGAGDIGIPASVVDIACLCRGQLGGMSD